MPEVLPAHLYFTGRPCKRGHFAPRYVKNKNCSACMAAAKSQWRKLERSEHLARKRRHWVSRMAHNWAGILINKAATRARKKGLAFDLTKDWAARRWTGKCEVTGRTFTKGVSGQGGGPDSASIDRIDSALGYTQDNCRFVTHSFNTAKGAQRDQDILSFAAAIEATRREAIAETLGFCA